MKQKGSIKQKSWGSLRWSGGLLAFCLLLAGLTAWDQYRESRSDMTIDSTAARTLIAETSTAADPAEPSRTPDEDDRVPVYLVGAVHRPGIYQVRRGSYLYELIEQAGGLSETAAAEAINLAASIDSNQLIRIPTQDEAESGYQFAWPDQQETGNGLVDLNRADQKQLETLPGVGPATAQAIIAWRTEKGFFERIEDLMQVPGIKEARFSALKDLVMVSGP